MKMHVRHMIRTIAGIVLLSLLSSALLGCNSWSRTAGDSEGQGSIASSFALEESEASREPESWIVKWKDANAREERILSQSIVLSEQPKLGITIIQPAADTKPEEWLQMLKECDNIEYVEANQRVKTMASSVMPNDAYISQQNYLKQIKADAAWAWKKKTPNMTIALVDTGVDMNHPDLKANLVKGVNLLEESTPQDDNGHGTSVAGVIAAVGNNSKGTAGVTWSANIMPIKALDARGYGDEDKLGAGILYAVDHGANIVVMSVGLYRYSNYMQDIVNYAEEKGVLLIAATGNDGTSFGEKVTVKYPAAYPSVLAVGGVTSDMKVDSRSNTGPEVDLVAPWNVFTTSLGGGYRANEGTSMAAPQVAGVAALVWSMYPELKPYQLREHLRRTAQDIGEKGWDSQSGYGMLRADLAVFTEPQDDSLSPNQTRDTARVFPIDTMQTGKLDAAKESEWYRVDVPYDGVLELNYARISGTGQVKVGHYAGNNSSYRTYENLGQDTIRISVKQGTQYLQIQSDGATKSNPIAYKVWLHFQIADDPFEPNDKQYAAYNLSAESQQITGTFSHKGDEDWYVIQLPTKATLSLKITIDTVRIDPQLEIRSTSLDNNKLIDENAEGQAEMTVLSDLDPGKLYVKVSNAVTAMAESVAGEYTLHIDYHKQYTDPNEPNDKQYEAVTIAPSTAYPGVFDSKSDKDWFQFRIQKDVYAYFSVEQIPSGVTVEMNLYKSGAAPILTARNAKGNSAVEMEVKLDPGKYFIQLSTNEKFDTQTYLFHADLITLVHGMHDIEGHWAQEAIVTALEQGWMNGYGDTEFAPNRSITRAEAAAVLTKVFKLEQKLSSKARFKDVPVNHWAYNAIEQVAQADIANGIASGLFAPNRQVTRAEMAVMIGNALKLTPGPIQTAPFRDVPANHWAASMLSEMKTSGLLGGIENNRYIPDRAATRAEFVALLYTVMESMS